jgi:predicted  nucleic acid-binding Zn-ribbon protein
LREIQGLQAHLNSLQSEHRITSETLQQLQGDVERKNDWLQQKDAEIERLSNALEDNLVLQKLLF